MNPTATNVNERCVIELDTMDFEMEAFQKDIRKLGIRAAYVEGHDPKNGGWPVVRYTGTRKALAALVDEWFDGEGLEAIEIWKGKPGRKAAANAVMDATVPLINRLQDLEREALNCAPNGEVDEAVIPIRNLRVTAQCYYELAAATLKEAM